MNSWASGAAAIAAAVSLAAIVRAAVATGLSSFEALEEPLVQFHPASGRFEPDSFINITEVEPGTFRMSARYRTEWWDGDRDTTNRDRQRAEVKGLGPHQRHGDAYEYTTTWRSNARFRGSTGFCHLFQLKSINGDSGAPLVTLSIRGDKAVVEANPDGPKIVAREFGWKPVTWQTVRIRVRTTPNRDGELMVSVDGDAFVGKTNVALSRPEADSYRPKWGLYRRAAVNAPMGDDYVEHKDVSAQCVGAAGIENAPMETKARLEAAAATPEVALRSLTAQPPSAARDFAVASIAALWAETAPPAAMAWAEKLPPGAARANAIGRIFSRWTDRDVTAAVKWLHVRAPRADLDELVWLFVTDTTYRYVQRSLALEAIPLIVDRELRANAMEHVAEIWSRAELERATDHVQQSPALAADQKKKIVERIRALRRGKSG
ncbi:MAG: heparin lyase I family protein [Opitutaceae bacterium]|nr:heparin lyase I family protein [Opitutaceae bacterium]